MRVTKEVAAENRRKILETATELFKLRGFDNVSVADLTKAAGFSHGGFYNHFKSKADLAAEAIRYAFGKALEDIAGDDAEGDPTRMAERLATYLSEDHRDNPGDGCPTASLPVDVGRSVPEAQQAYAEGLESYIERIEAVLPAESRSRDAAIATLSRLVGAMILARAVKDGRPDLSDEILSAASVRPATRQGTA